MSVEAVARSALRRMDNLRAVSKDQRAAYLSSLSRAELQKVAKEAGLKVRARAEAGKASLNRIHEQVLPQKNRPFSSHVNSN